MVRTPCSSRSLDACAQLAVLRDAAVLVGVEGGDLALGAFLPRHAAVLVVDQWHPQLMDDDDREEAHAQFQRDQALGQSL